MQEELLKIDPAFARQPAQRLPAAMR